MIKSLIRIALSYFLIFGQTITYAQSTAAILPQGQTQFLNQNADPLTSGKVYFYIPSTLTPKTTWQNSTKTIANTNPVILDAAGRAIIYGDGTYRQIVKDRNGNTIFDALTASAGSGGGTTGTGDGDLVGTVKPWAGLVAPNQYAFAYGQEISRTTYSVLFTAVTSKQPIACTSGNPTATGFSDTSQFAAGQVIESICFAPATSIISKTSTTVTFNTNASISTTDSNAIIFLYGNGNASTTFNLPDLRGYVVAGRPNMGGVDAGNLSGFVATGVKGGTQNRTLITANLPAYIPAGSVTAAGTISQITPAGSVSSPTITINNGTNLIQIGGSSANATFGGGGGTSQTVTATSSQPVFTGTPVTPTFTNDSSTFTGTAQGGTSTAFSIVQPTQTLNYIIKITPDSNSTDASGVTSLGGMTGDIACGTGILCTGNIISVSFPNQTGTDVYLPVCGGVNDTSVIQTAENALSVAGGGTLHFQAGICKVTTLTKLSNTIWEGAGIGTTFIISVSGTVTNAVIQGLNAYTLFGTGSLSGITSFSIRDMTINGSADSGSTGDCIGIYGWVFSIENLEITNCSGNGLRTQYGIPGVIAHGGPWASVHNVWIYNNDGAGILWQGPPDSSIFSANVYGNLGPGIKTGVNGTGLKIVNSHNSGLLTRQNQYGFYLDTLGNMISNSTSEGATIAQVWLRDNANTITGGRYYYTTSTPNTVTGIRIGEAGVKAVSSSNIYTEIDNTQSGTIWFDNDGGFNTINVKGYQSTSAGTFGYIGDWNGNYSTIQINVAGDITPTNKTLFWNYTWQSSSDGISSPTIWYHGITGSQDVTTYWGTDTASSAGILKWDNSNVKWQLGINGTIYAELTSTTLDLLAGVTLSGADLTNATVSNAKLANSATTVNGQTCTLGATCTVTAAAAGVTVGTTTITSGTNGHILYDNSGILGELTAGTTTTLLHGNAAGAPTFGVVVSADLNITTTSCTNQFLTAISATAVGTCTTDTLTSAQHANQGTTTTVLHGNAAGNPSWGNVSLTSDVTGTLPVGNGGLGIATVAQGDILYASALNTIVALTKDTNSTRYLSNTGTSNNPAWAQVNLTTGVSGTLPAGSGGTGITSLGIGVATALGVNVGSAGAFVTFNGALGTPSSGTATNLTGTASGLTAGNVTTNANLTGVITSVGNATSIASQTGTGTKVVVDTTPTLVTPILGVATVTSINKVAITSPATSATLTIADGTTLTETTSTSIGRGQYQALATNTTASAGNIGEIISSSVSSGSSVALPIATATQIATITLTAGNWKLCGQMSWSPAATTNVTYLWGSIDTTTATMNSNNGTWSGDQFGSGGQVINNSNLGISSSSVMCSNVSLSGNTNYFLNAKAGFSISTLGAWGYINGVRTN